MQSSVWASSLSRSASMPLVKNAQIVADHFTRIADDESIPANGAILVSAQRLLGDLSILDRGDDTGVIWPNNRDIEEIAPLLNKLAIIALVFPIFRDGRAYSQARILRERLGFKKEMRATGQVLRDQFVFMLRAGFDAFEVKKDTDANAFAEVAKRYTVFYQPTGDGRVTAFRQRLQSHRASLGNRT
jgi:uncharacterized protein (DUF934 family)